MVPAGFGDWPRWLRNALVAGGAALGVLYLLGRRAHARDQDSGEAALAAGPKRRPGQRHVIVAGRRGAGKSTVANGLLGTLVFGPDAAGTETAQLRDEWYLQELPAAALQARDPASLRSRVADGDIVLLVVEESLSRQERQFLALLREARPAVRLLAFLNKLDAIAAVRTPDQMAALRADARRQTAGYLTDPDADLLEGSAGGPHGDVSALRARLEALLDAGRPGHVDGEPADDRSQP